MVNSFFRFLCDIIEWIGQLMGWDYQTASVYVGIYIFPIVCLVFPCILFIKTILYYQKSKNSHFLFSCFGVGSCFLLLCLFFSVYIAHYWAAGSLHNQYYACMNDFRALSTKTGFSYAELNVLFYAVFPFVIILSCLIMGWALKRMHK